MGKKYATAVPRRNEKTGCGLVLNSVLLVCAEMVGLMYIVKCEEGGESMKLWYRCEMCSPNQSKCFDVKQTDSLTEAMQLVGNHHRLNSPSCPAAKNVGNTVVEILLVRMVQ